MEKFNDSLPIILALEIEIFSYSEVLDIFPSTSKKELADKHNECLLGLYIVNGKKYDDNYYIVDDVIHIEK